MRRSVVSVIRERENILGLAILRSENSISVHTKESFASLIDSFDFRSTDFVIPKIAKHPEQNLKLTLSILVSPIGTQESLAGIFSVIKYTEPFSAFEIDIIETISTRLSSIIDRKRWNTQREQLIVSLAHEINTPLVAILADSENLLNEIPKKSPLHKIAKNSTDQVLRLYMLVENAMGVIANIPRYQFSLHNIYRPIWEACELFREEATFKGCEILKPVPIDGEFPVIEMSLYELTNSFKNLVHNAVNYSFRSPKSKNKYQNIKIWGRYDKAKPGYYFISIQNYGIGIEIAEIEKRLLFEPYYRGNNASDRRRTGSGFGLAYTRKVIEDIHHGNIMVTSIPIDGSAYLTTFTIQLPLQQGQLKTENLA